jgi:cytoskeletal protein CcmA (bactofilin family)
MRVTRWVHSCCMRADRVVAFLEERITALRRSYLHKGDRPLIMTLDQKLNEDHAALAPPPCATDPVTIRKSLRIKGEVIGSESLFIEGRVYGIVSVPNCRVTIGQDAEVFADIAAREVIVVGKVVGDIEASDRVDLRSDSSLTGVVTTRRIQIGEGAHFQGGISIIAQDH